ncbi:hypothetical protein EVG20_g6809 [Dentipellis fragilis]|uniref:Uncharacterized protein n=1 Tax=Dentipellis fragilis TaxID=205917 RepID=A0A4Y9YHX7_9AGAM|nr:hypothetical protein EVG20_g6809 [Dentipellis fragilis]
MIIFTLYSLGAASRLMPHHRYFVRRLSKDVGRLSTSASARAASTKTTVGVNESKLTGPIPPVPSKTTLSRPEALQPQNSKLQFDWRMYRRDSVSNPSTPLALSQYWCSPQLRDQDGPINSPKPTSETRRAEFPRSPLDIWVDASPIYGLGIIIGHRWAAWQHVGSESPPLIILDNNDLELLAIEFAVYHLAHDIALRYADVCIRGDNLGVIGSLTNKTSSKELWRESIDRIHKSLDQAKLTLNLKYVASKMNLAHPTSRGLAGPEAYRLQGKFKVPKPLKGYFKRAN